jgi:parallel beta-helix repeat protein
VSIGDGGNPTLRRNRINFNNHEAVSVHAGGAGLVEDNDLSDNIRGAFEIAPGAEGSVSRVGNRE